MSSFVFSNAKLLLSSGSLQFNNGIFKFALIGDAKLFDDKSYCDKTKWSEIKDLEIGIGNVGYVKHEPLRAVKIVTVANDGSDDILVCANDITYPISTISAVGAVIVTSNYAYGEITNNDKLVLAIDLRTNGSAVSSNNGVFTVKLGENSGGFLRIK